MSSSNRVLSVLFLSRNLQIRFLLVVIAFAACIPCRAGAGDSHSVTPDEAVAVDRAVRAFHANRLALRHSRWPSGLDQVFRCKSSILYGR